MCIYIYICKYNLYIDRKAEPDEPLASPTVVYVAAGAMGGLGIAMIVCGALLGVGILFLFLHLKNRQDDGMTVQFKNEDS